MNLRLRRGVLALVLTTATGLGFASRGYSRDDDCCEPPKRWSAEWYAQRAGRPIGARQKFHVGKLWPPFPRPTGEKPELSHRFHAAHYWPHPYNCQDRHYVYDVLHAQATNGWAKETTLYDYHFDEEQQLDRSGWMQLEWILKHAPPAYRVVWVQCGFNPMMSQQRLEVVQTAALEMAGPDAVPPIMLRVDSAVGRPADEIDQMRTQEMESMPDPRITYEALPLGTGGGN